ncbi:MAG: acetate kinase [Rhodospirillales bacterium 20-58-10]|nr:MAG: acetate kinase [Rhodospirillales bacterium 20-58-10]
MPEAILTLNAGSSSIKFALFTFNHALSNIARGEIEGIGETPHFAIHGPHSELLLEKTWPHGETLSHEDLLSPVLEWVDHHLGDIKLAACGHRIVHGGDIFTAPTLLDDDALARLSTLDPLAPLHEPHNLAAVKAAMVLRPGLAQIGCFDTSFHKSMPAVATRFALPRNLRDQGVRRYGFHGLSYEYIAAQLRLAAPDIASGRVIAAHLGNGASACALRNGQSMDSSMGFTALDGLIMGTRTGALDPGVLLYLMQAHGMNADEITNIVYKKSGLLGISGISPDMRVLLASNAPEAAEAVESFTYAAAQHIAALVVPLGGLDGLVFTAGIGEHSPEIRAAICARLQWLGIAIDPLANAKNALVISKATSAVEIMVIPTNEEAMIARHCVTLLAQHAID